MKNIGFRLVVVFLAVAALPALGCGSKSKDPAPEPGEAVESLLVELPGAEAAPPPTAAAEPADAGDAASERDRDDSGGVATPDVHFVPTPRQVVRKMLEVAEVTKDDLVYDLGCGDGRIVIMAAREFGARAVGYDIDPEMVAKSRANVKEAGLEHLVRIEQANIFELDLTPASVITLYLLPSLNVRLIPQLEKLKKGTRVVSHDFDMEGMLHEQFHVVTVSDDDDGGGSREHHVYYWTIPLRPETE